MSKKINAQSVTDFLGFVIGLGKEFKVNAQGTIIQDDNTDKETPVKINHDGKDYSVRVFQDPVPHGSFWLLNPFNTTTRTTPELSWFYRLLTTTLSANILFSLKLAVAGILHSKDDLDLKNIPKPSIRHDSKLSSIMSGQIGKKSLFDEVDVRVYEEIEQMLQKPSTLRKFVTLGYQSRDLTTHFHIAPLKSGDDWYEDELELKIRKKTIRVIERLLFNFFDCSTVEDFEKFTATAEENEAPRLGAWLRCYANVTEQLNVVVERVLPGREQDIASLREWFKSMPQMSNRAKLISGGFHDDVDITTIGPVDEPVNQAPRTGPARPVERVDNNPAPPRAPSSETRTTARPPATSRPRDSRDDDRDYRRGYRDDRDYDRDRGRGYGRTPPRRPRDDRDYDRDRDYRDRDRDRDYDRDRGRGYRDDRDYDRDRGRDYRDRDRDYRRDDRGYDDRDYDRGRRVAPRPPRR